METRFNKAFFVDLGERTVATFAQALVAIFTVLAIDGGGLAEVDWKTALSVAGLAALLAILKGFAADLGDPDTGASFGATTPVRYVAAFEDHNVEGRYEAGEAAPYKTGTPVDVVPDFDPAPEHLDTDHR